MTLGLCLAAQAGAEDAALRVLDECRARLDPRTDIGIERVQRRCPELLPALENAPWRGLLPSTLGQRREEISAQSLRTLADLVRRHELGAIAHPRDAAAIAGVLERALREFTAGRYVAQARPVDIDRYHRRELAREFARAFEDAVALARARSGKGRKAA